MLNGRSGHVSEVTRQKVLAAADALGYHLNTPARQLASGVTNTIGLVVRQSSKQLAGDPFLGATLYGLASVARASGYRVVVESIAPGERNRSPRQAINASEPTTITAPSGFSEAGRRWPPNSACPQTPCLPLPSA